MTVVIVVFSIYYLLLLILLAGWYKALQLDVPDYRHHFKISVIVAFRNEEKNITTLIRDLTTQTYNHEFFEVILCNDHSTDESIVRVNKAIDGLANFRLIHSPLDGKKNALSFGIENSNGEIIATTDGDCSVPENWLARINHAFQNDQLKMVFGGVVIKSENTFFSKLQAMELTSLIATAASTAGLGIPILCNGANLAFHKSVFVAVNGYEGNLEIPSGDDEFLMNKIIRYMPGSVRFLNTGDSVVSTTPQPTTKELLQQRLRWAGKWRYNASLTSKSIAIFVLLFQVLFLYLLVSIILDFSHGQTAFGLIGGKILLEFIVLFQCCSFLRLRWRTVDFVTLQFLYPVYVIFIGVASNFLSYEWKGRKWKHKAA